MIEVIYKDENQDTQENEGMFALPRNIRQIGQIRDDCKIYMEDYVYTFLVRLSRSGEKDEQNAKVAVFTGETQWRDGTVYFFIKGAIMTEDMEAAQDHIDFSKEIWEKINEEQKTFFENQEIIGWFFSQPQLVLEPSELFTKVHLKYFGGEKILMLMEPQEREDAFFRYENNSMVRLGGYYIYYEKNPCMQEYMLEKNKELENELTEKVEDDAVKNFRKIISDKKDTKKEQETSSVFSYVATACLVAAVLAAGFNFYRNYRNLNQNMEKEESRTVSSVILEEATPVPSRSEKTEITSTPIPAKTVLPETSKNKKTAEEVSSTSAQIYHEEADTRKAQKRVREEVEKENQAAVSASLHETYVIQPGDTLYQISMDRYGNTSAIKKICELNKMSVDQIIYPGQIIVLP